MWRLIQQNLHNKLLSHNSAIFKKYFCQAHIKNYISRTVSQKPVPKSFIPSKVTTFGVTLTGGLIIKLYISRNGVLCEAKKTRMAGYENKLDKNVKFDWARLWMYLKPHIWYFLAAIVGALAVALLNIQIPQVIGGVVNVLAKFSESRDSELFLNEMKKPVIKLISMYLAQSVCTFFYIFMLSNLGERMAYKMRTDLFESILKQDIAFFDQQRTGEIINRLTADIQDFKSSFKQTVSGGLRAATQIVGCSVSLIMISPQMTFISLLCIPSVIAVGTIFGSLLRSVSRRAQAQVEKTTAVADEAVSNIRTVRAFAMEDQEKELFNTEADRAMVLNEDLGLGIGLFQAGTNMFINGCLMKTCFFQYINKTPKMALTGGKILPYELVKGDIEFKNVCFAYPTRSQQVILQGFNLSVPSGKTVAIVGASGNGKSTVVALLERFYDVKDGSITLDGHDIRTLDPSWLRGRVLGLISQEPVLFGTTIMENIRYGKPDASDDEVKEAALLANADEFITSFPKGYNTPVGERGVTLSGGQKQRIAIARALLKNPVVLLLDEATSALDTESEKIVQHALERARTGRTVIVIAHRLSTIQNADLIVVLNKGKIVEMGTHESLKKLGGYYWSLAYQQQNSPAG
ncbi:mitochondrial potassium channel ATP-binding subunit isoform X2 [Diabrotica undecimpunctata]|uniref:mitochondrial potassium channel ATP-binding subunit isoform X2 n=1 Tax=Diabrotica undecimpunctata TaxID=50387 RepID=UPI003B63B45A